MSFRLGLLTCAWKRLELSRITMAANIAAAGPDAVGECVETIDPDKPKGCDGLLLVNRWKLGAWRNVMGEKWNVALALMQDENPDAVMILGTDDLVSPEIFRAAAKAIAAGKAWFGLLDVYVFDAWTREARYWPGYVGTEREGETIGTCRTFSRAYLDAHDWKLWPDEAKSSLDSYSNPARQNVPGEVVRMRDCGGAVVDVKAYPGIDLGSVHDFVPSREASIDECFGKFPEETVGKILNLRDAISGNAARPKSNGTSNPLVVACIIARDCADTIGRAIFTADRVCDEVVVVIDDRTTDDTRAAALKAHAYCFVRKFDDFSGQRNFALDEARALGATWALILDGDEWLDEPGDLREQIEKAEPETDVILATWMASPDSKMKFAEIAPGQARVVRLSQCRYRFPKHHVLVGARNAAQSSAVVMERYDDNAPSLALDVEMLTPLLDGDADEKRHAMHYLARAHFNLAENSAKSSERDEESVKYESAQYARAEQLARDLTVLAPEDAGNWRTLIDAIERQRGLLAIGEAIGGALRAHPRFMDFHWYFMRYEAAVLCELAADMDTFRKYAAVPQRAARYMSLMPSAGPFLAMRFGEQKPAAPEPAKIVVP